MDAGIWLVSFWFIWVESFRKSFLKNEGFDVHHSLETTKPNCFCWIRNLVVLITHFNTTPAGVQRRKRTDLSCCLDGTDSGAQIQDTHLLFFVFAQPVWRHFRMMGGVYDGRCFSKNVESKEGKGCLEIRLVCLVHAFEPCRSWSFLGSFLLSSLFWAPPRLGVCLAKSDHNQ